MSFLERAPPPPDSVVATLTAEGGGWDLCEREALEVI